MKAAMLFAGSGPLVILTSHASLIDPVLLGKLRAKGIHKFIGYEIAVETAKSRYGSHFDTVLRDLQETDDLRVLDFNGDRAFRRFRLAELGQPILYEEDEATHSDPREARRTEGF